jgi:16S rRNA (cytidine1402-2'-O)-methyltransferase
MPGTLFVVATPIGNLEDLTFRALRTLKEVDAVAAEDTRRTSKLLAHYGISRRLVSLHEHNEHREAPKLVARIAAGESVALVSDAGTPAISDPGTTLVRLCREAGLPVRPIPGASAITAALSVSGIPAIPFTFLGFPPASGLARGRWLETVRDANGTVVFFEAPHRIHNTLDALAAFGIRPIIVHRELTKIHEESAIYPTLSELLTTAKVVDRGEFVVVIGPQAEEAGGEHESQSVLALYDQLSSIASLTRDQALAATAAAFGLPMARTKTLVKKARILVKRQTDG